MIPLGSETSTSTPITRIPYNVLREIFEHCLPQSPLRGFQPNTTIAPMLLCHICSSWRTVALASATLWSHLSFSVTILKKGKSYLSDLVKNEVEFIRWWRRNHGSIAPFLSFSVRYRNLRDIDQELDRDGMSFLLEYTTSAQYLKLDNIFWGHLRDRIKAGNIFIFPYLRTLEKYGWEPVSDDFFRVQTECRPPYAFSISNLQHLSITDDSLEMPNISHIPSQWSTLTHISLNNTPIALKLWNTLIRTLPNLQWGYFDLTDVYGPIDEADFKPTRYILPQLSTLCVAFNDNGAEIPPDFSISWLFSNLYLPAVRTLSLSWIMTNTEYYDHDLVSELYTILQSTPAVTTLLLAEHFIPLPQARMIKHIEPVWAHATHLVDLQLDLLIPDDGERDYPDYEFYHRNTEELEEVLDIFVQDALFSEGGWVDLQNPACPIRAITIVDKEFLSDDEPDDSIGAFAMESIQEHAEKAPDIIFRVISESDSARALAADEWGELSARI